MPRVGGGFVFVLFVFGGGFGVGFARSAFAVVSFFLLFAFGVGFIALRVRGGFFFLPLVGALVLVFLCAALAVVSRTAFFRS